MTTIWDFAFANPYIPAAFFVAGMLVTFKYQWQAFFFFMVVIYAVTTIEQFALCSVILVAQLLVSGFYNAAGSERR